MDGSGTEFLLVFPWNNAPFGSKQDIYLDLINLDEFSSAHVNITYYTLNENNTSEKNEDYIAVPSTNARTVSVKTSNPLYLISLLKPFFNSGTEFYNLVYRTFSEQNFEH